MEEEEVKIFKWALAGVGGLAVAAIVVVSALGGSITQAEEPGGEGRGAMFNEAMANQLGISVEELVAGRQEVLNQALDAAVASGRITPEQAEEIRENPRKARRQFIRNAASHVRGFVGDIMSVAADSIGISKETLVEGLKSGQSLGQIAEANGTSKADLKADLTSAVEAKLDAAVAEGKISQEQADKVSANLSERLDNLIDRVPGERPAMTARP